MNLNNLKSYSPFRTIFLLILLVSVGNSTILGTQLSAANGKGKPNLSFALGKPRVYQVHSKAKKSDYFLNMPIFNTEQGLALSSITFCMRDHSGLLWFGTAGAGASMYDGKHFFTLNISNGLPGNVVYCIFEDSKHFLWFGTNAGVCCYNGKSIVQYSEQNGLPYNVVRSVAEDELGNIWLGTDGGGLCYFDGRSFHQPANNKDFAQLHVNCLLKEKNGRLWVGTDMKGLFYVSGRTIIPLNQSNSKEASLLSTGTVLSLLEDNSGNLFIGLKEHGVLCLQNGQLVTLKEFEDIKKLTVRSIFQDKKGDLWMCTHQGAFKLDHANKNKLEHITTKQGLAYNALVSVAEDLRGNLWFGTFGGGICRYEGESCKAFTTNQGLPSDIVYSIAEDMEGRKWFGTTDSGAFFEKNGVFHQLEGAGEFGHKAIFSILRDHEGNLWFASENDHVLYELVLQKSLKGDEVSGKLYEWGFENGLPRNKITCLTEDANHQLWMGTDGGGVICLKKEKFKIYTTADGLPDNSVLSSLCAKDGGIWFGFAGKGLCRFDGVNFINYTKRDGLVNPVVFCLLEDLNGTIWAGTEGGISKMTRVWSNAMSNPKSKAASENGNGAGLRKGAGAGNGAGVGNGTGVGLGKNIEFQFENITQKDGLSDLVVYSLTKIGKETMVAGTNQGLSFIQDGKIEIFANKTGYPIKDANSNAMFSSENGIIWLGTGDKLVKFAYNLVNTDTMRPKLWLEQVLINGMQLMGELNIYGEKPKEVLKDSLNGNFKGVSFESVENFHPIPVGLVLPYQHNSITLDLNTNEVGKPSMIKYQYFLEGYEKDWSPVTDNSRVEYGNIHEGSYTFKARACSPEGIWSLPITYRFKVNPPFYRSWYMYLIYFGATLGFLFVVLRWRTSSLRRDKERLRRLVSERTAEVVLQKDEAERQKELLFLKNKEITDSINYAQRIQDAMLKPKQNQLINIPDHFILLKPKDIVSGDFYWATKKENYWYIAAVDCTGHGVPGAFMSMLGLALLNEITARDQAISPAEILDALRYKIIKELHQSGGVEDNRDGMDMSLARIQLDNNEVQWAGANNSLYIVQELDGLKPGEKKLIEIKGDKQPIGFHPSSTPFTNHRFSLKPKTQLYLFTDGFADQFGGPNGKKMMYKKFETALLQYADLGLDEQKKALSDYFEAWKKGEEQVDDVCVIGIIL